MALHATRAARQAWKARSDIPAESVDGACDGQTQKRRRVAVKRTANLLDVQDVSLVEPPFQHSPVATRTQLAFQRKVHKTFAELSQDEACGICRDKLHGESDIGFLAGSCHGFVCSFYACCWPLPLLLASVMVFAAFRHA